MYILNRVPTNVALKTSFELWKDWKPSLQHIRIWGCPFEVRVYNPQENKLDLKTISGFFVGYTKRSKWYIFYYPTTLGLCNQEMQNSLRMTCSMRVSNLKHSLWERSIFHFKWKVGIIHNTSQVQMGVEQPIVEVPQAIENNPID